MSKGEWFALAVMAGITGQVVVRWLANWQPDLFGDVRRALQQEK